MPGDYIINFVIAELKIDPMRFFCLNCGKKFTHSTEVDSKCVIKKKVIFS